jgi:hypothetical protein
MDSFTEGPNNSFKELRYVNVNVQKSNIGNAPENEI